MKKWLVTGVILLALVALGYWAEAWLPPLLSFAGAQSEVLGGLASLVQLVLWVSAGLVLAIRLWRGRKGEERPGGGTVVEARGSVVASAGGTADGAVGVAVGRDVHGDLTVITADSARLWQLLGKKRPAEDLRRATASYLQFLVARYQYLDFKGMGVSDRVPLRLPLLEMYVPLKARIEMPKGETWARELRLAGRKVSAEEAEALGERVSRPTPVLDLLRDHDGLVVLGDPGAGKTTFLKYLTLRFASGRGEDLGLGPRLPVLAPLSAYATALDGRDVPLSRFVAEHYLDRGVELPIGAMLEEALEQGGALILLDGLDEVKDPGQRRLVVERVQDFYSLHRQAGNKFVLSSRVVGYREVRPTAEGLAECTLVDFDDEEVETFADKWTGAIEKAAAGATRLAESDAGRERKELLAAVYGNPGVRALATNPLLLTILALMKRQGVSLPERRVELYQKYVETLLKHWNLARGLDRPPSHDLDVLETLKILAPLALWMHETAPGVGLVKEQDLIRRLEEIFRERGEGDPERVAGRFLEDVREHAGLLLDRGGRQFGFIHLTFQEYLAGMAMARRAQEGIRPLVEALSRHAGEAAWHEVSLLAVSYLGIVQQRDEAASRVVAGLLETAAREPGETTALAGEAVADAWPGGVTAACKARVVGTLVTTLREDGRVKAPFRARAGHALGKLGDPRQEVTSLEAMEFCYIPQGTFWMGSNELEDERPLHQNPSLDYGYWLGRFPVTAEQYRPFALDSGQDPTASGGAGNHPVVGVTWYQAIKFCAWLTERWRRSGIVDLKWAVRLPSEAEWEKAARGGVVVPAELLIRRPGEVLAQAGTARRLRTVANRDAQRSYPWGDRADPNRANYRASEVDGTSAVGCFPGGASPYGCEDLAGNVWELTRSLWSKHWRKSAFPYPYDPRDGREQLDAVPEAPRVCRGGSFNGDGTLVRCAARARHDPISPNWYLGFRVAICPVDGGA